MTLPLIVAPTLGHPRLVHAFFTRQGGVSEGVYRSLNGGVGSRDDRAAVHENRRRMAEALGVAPDRLVIPYQIHSPNAVIVEAPFGEQERPRCDGVVTCVPGLALGVTGADCGVVLFADAEAGVIGAAHAGWKGAFGGVLESTVAAMERLGAKRRRISAVLGPTIGQASYEVGPEFRERFLAENADFARYFRASGRDGHHLFDLPGFIGFRLERAEVGAFADLGLDTYADEERFFSYRRATHRGEPDYGRLVAAVALTDGSSFEASTKAR